MHKYNQDLRKAVQHFWCTRASQTESQGKSSGKKDAGSRSAVTGGKHADGFVELISAVVRDSGMPSANICVSRGETRLPGYFRPSKDWDVVVFRGTELIAVVEIKAHVGSFGNNFNNRVEEALGNATDFWAAYAKASFAPSGRPWLGYIMMLEDAAGSTRRTKTASLPHVPLRTEFQNASYAERYQLFCERIVRERLYDSTCFLMSNEATGRRGDYREPSQELSFRSFAAALAARVLGYVQLNDLRKGLSHGK